jgi:hypothetical protein
MNLSAPTQPVFIIAVILALVALLMFLGVFAIGVPSFWIMTVAFALLAVACLVKGL